VKLGNQRLRLGSAEKPTYFCKGGQRDLKEQEDSIFSEFDGSPEALGLDDEISELGDGIGFVQRPM
jgi:hypothetical protein